MAIELRGVVPLVQVYDMPTSVRFYRDKLGFTIVTISPPLGGEDRFHWCLLRLGEAELMLNTAYEFDDERPVPPDPVRKAAHNDTCFYLVCPDVDAAYTELRAREVPVQPPTVAPYGMKRMSLRDPDGYALCFQWPVK